MMSRWSRSTLCSSSNNRVEHAHDVRSIHKGNAPLLISGQGQVLDVDN